MKLLVAMAGWLLLLPVVASAGSIYNYAYGGNFTSDDNVQVLYFYLSEGSDVKVYTLSFGGGTYLHNEDSRTDLSGDVDPGGFVPVLSLFSLSEGGALVSGGLAIGGGGPGSNATGDASLDFNNLGPGWYAVALTQNDNLPVGDLGYPGEYHLGNGFSQEGNTNFTAFYGCLQGQFCDITGAQLGSYWALEIENVDYAGYQTPEPGSLALCLIVVLIFGMRLGFSRWKQAPACIPLGRFSHRFGSRNRGESTAR